MGFDFRFPNITGATDKEQLTQIKSYLHQLVEQLQWAMNTVETQTTDSVIYKISQGGVSVPTKPSSIDAEATFGALKSLIIKSADIVGAYYEEINEKLKGEYVAISDFGTFKEETEQSITKNSTDITQSFTNIQQIESNIFTNIQEVESNIFTNIQQIETNILDIETDFSYIEKDLNDTKTSIETSFITIEKDISDLDNSINSEIGNLSTELEGTKSTIGNLNTGLEDTKSNINNLSTELEGTKTNIGNISTELEGAKSNINNLDISIKDAKSEIGNLNTGLEDAKSNINVLGEGLGTANSNIDQLGTNLHETKNNINSNMNALTENVGTIDNNLQDLKTDVENGMSEIKGDVDTLNNNLDNMKSDIDSAIDGVKDDIDKLNTVIVEVNANIKTGLLYYDEYGIPVYGLEIGQKNTVNGVEIFNKYARFTAGRLSFYDSNGYEVAYISDYKLYITNAEITGTLKLGSFLIDTEKGFRLKWAGRG